MQTLNIEKIQNKNLYKIVLNDKVFYQSYNTIVLIEENDKILVNNTYYSKTTTTHINTILKQKQYKQPLLIPLKVFKQIVNDNGLTFNDY